MSNFKVGDRVTSKSFKGPGTVVGLSVGSGSSFVRVRWDSYSYMNDKDYHDTHMGELSPLPKKKYSFTKGQKIIYCPPEDKAPSKTVIATISSSIETDDDYCWVDIEYFNPEKGSPSTNSWYAKNIKPLPTNEEVEAAKKTLMIMGDLTFKPRKPPFNPIRIKGVGEYNATVHTDEVIVGCQQISFDAVKAIYSAVLKAEEYNKS